MNLSNLSLMLAIFASAVAVGGGIFEMSVLVPQWAKNPPASFATIQEGTGVPLQRFWIPVHIAITITLLLTVIVNWSRPTQSTLILAGIGCYVIMRAWSGFYFIPEMLAFQKIPLESASTAELTERVIRWGKLTWLREPLDLGLFFCLLSALAVGRSG